MQLPTISISLLLQLFSVVASFQTLWIFIQKWRFHGLANVPGPDGNWWQGNYKQAFNPKAWKFHEMLLKTCMRPPVL